ncbi:MAG: hypothetical protein CMK33_01150 [Porticoccaceae bacterium]|nr:hypothetical protein [Porticoccaceae bacterium]
MAEGMADVYSSERVRRSLLHFAFGKTFGVIAGLGLLLVIVRALDPADYGFYVAAQALLEVIAQFSSFGLLVAAQRYLPELMAKREGRALERLSYGLVAGRIATLALALMLLYPVTHLVAHGLDLEGHEAAIRLYLVVIFFESLARFLEVIFDSLLLQGVSQIALLLRAGIRVAGISALFVHAGGHIELEHWILIDAFAAFAGALWGGLSLVRFLRRHAGSSPGDHAQLEPRRYARYSLPLFVAASMYTASGPNTVKLVASSVLSTVQFAAFGFAAAFSAMLQRYLPVFLLIGMIRPLFVAARQRDDYSQRLPAMAALVFRLNAFALVPVIAFLVVAGEVLASLLTGGRYPLAAGYLLAFAVVLLAQAFRAVASMTAQAMENARAPIVGTGLGLLGLGVGLALNAPWPGYGLCAGLVLSELLFGGWVIRALRGQGLEYRAGLRFYALVVAHGVVGALVAAGVLAASGALGAIVALGLSAIAGLAAYLLSAFAWKPFSAAERDTLNRILKRKVFVW